MLTSVTAVLSIIRMTNEHSFAADILTALGMNLFRVLVKIEKNKLNSSRNTETILNEFSLFYRTYQLSSDDKSAGKC